MENKYTYKSSFEISLKKCDSCGVWYSKQEIHSCSNMPIPQTDVLETLMENTRPKTKKKGK